MLRCENTSKIVPGASHPVEEGGAPEHVASLGGWFTTHLAHLARVARRTDLLVERSSSVVDRGVHRADPYGRLTADGGAGPRGSAIASTTVRSETLEGGTGGRSRVGTCPSGRAPHSRASCARWSGATHPRARDLEIRRTTNARRVSVPSAQPLGQHGLAAAARGRPYASPLPGPFGARGNPPRGPSVPCRPALGCCSSLCEKLRGRWRGSGYVERSPIQHDGRYLRAWSFRPPNSTGTRCGEPSNANWRTTSPSRRSSHRASTTRSASQRSEDWSTGWTTAWTRSSSGREPFRA